MKATFPKSAQITLALVTLLYCLFNSSPALSQNLVVDGSNQYQVIDGFGANVNSLSWNNGELRPALDLLVDQLGATIFRVVTENADLEATNDNSDPNVFNWDYYNGVYTSAKFEELWSTIAYLNQKGITSGLMLSFMGPVAARMGGSAINTNAEDEWVESIASLLYYAKFTRDLQIGLLSPMNETDPDGMGIEGPQVGAAQYVRLMSKLAQKLDAIGLGAIRLVGPDTCSVPVGVATYLPAMMGNSVLMGKLDHFALHAYYGTSEGAQNVIDQSAYRDRNFWITELADIGDTLSLLSQGVSAVLVWEGYDSVYNHALGRGTTPPNDASPDGPPLIAYNTGTGAYTPRKVFFEYAQLFKFVTPGSRRIQATESISSLTVYAFHHPNGRTTIVGRNESNSSRILTGSLKNLPAIPLLEHYQTNASSDLKRQPDVSVANNGSFSVTISPNTIFTLTTLQDEDPHLTITSPVPNQVISESPVQVTYQVGGDRTGVAHVNFRLDSAPEVTAEVGGSLYQFSGVSDGQHTLTGYLVSTEGSEMAGTKVSVPFSVGAQLTALILNPASVVGGTPSTGTVTLNSQAPSGGAEVFLSSSDSSVGTVQSSVTVAGGATTAAFAVTTKAVTTSTSVRISASRSGIIATASLTVAAPQLNSLALNPTSLAGGALSTGTVTLSGVAPSGGAEITLLSSDTSVATVPASVTVAGGSTSATFTTTTKAVSSSRSTTISAIYKGITKSSTLRVNLSTLTLASVSLAPAQVVGGSPSTGTLTLSSQAPSGGAVVTLSSSNTSVATVVPASVTVSSGRTSTTFTVTTNAGANSTQVTISATYNGVTLYSALSVNPSTSVNRAPVVTITSPGDGTIYTPLTTLATVVINAEATDSDGSVAKVEFFVGGSTKLGEDTSTPFSFTWNTVGAGSYSLTARATDNRGVTTTSSPINITVNPTLVVSIGNTNDGTVADNIYDNGAWINASRFRAPSNMTVTMMKAKIAGVTGKYKCAIYADNNGSPGSLLIGTAELNNPGTGWQTSNLTSSLNLTGGTYYWLTIWSDSSAARVYYTNNGTIRWGKYSYGTWPAQLNTTGGGTYNYCIYAQ